MVALRSPFLEGVRDDMRQRGYSLATERSYLLWIKRYIHFCELAHPREVGPDKIRECLTCLAVKWHVSVNTQKVALNALVLIYQKYLGRSKSQCAYSARITRRDSAAA